MEREAYTKGNLIFRDFEDLIKTGKIEVLIDFTKSGEPKMSLKEWKNNEINTKLMKKWGLLTEQKTPPGDDPSETGQEMQKDPSADIDPEKGKELNEDSEEEESKHYGEDESADKREEDRLEHHLDAIEGHLKALRDDMGFDEKHIDENKEDPEQAPPLKGAPPKATPKDPEWYDDPSGGVRGSFSSKKSKEHQQTRAGLEAARKKSGSQHESISRKISVREAKELTRRVLARIRKEKK